MILYVKSELNYNGFMKIQCAWCSFIIEDSDDGLTSHGICPCCKKKILQKNDDEREGKKNQVQHPIDSFKNRKDLEKE